MNKVLHFITSKNQMIDAILIHSETHNAFYMCGCCSKISKISDESNYHGERAPKITLFRIIRNFYTFKNFIGNENIILVISQDIGPMEQSLALYAKKQKIRTILLPDGFVHRHELYKRNVLKALATLIIGRMYGLRILRASYWGCSKPDVVFCLNEKDREYFSKHASECLVTGSPRLEYEASKVKAVTNQDQLLVCSTPIWEAHNYSRSAILDFYSELLKTSHDLSSYLGCTTFSIKLHPGEIGDRRVPDFLSPFICTDSVVEAISKSRYLLSPLSTVLVESALNGRVTYIWKNPRFFSTSNDFEIVNANVVTDVDEIALGAPKQDLRAITEIRKYFRYQN